MLKLTDLTNEIKRSFFAARNRLTSGNDVPSQRVLKIDVRGLYLVHKSSNEWRDLCSNSMILPSRSIHWSFVFFPLVRTKSRWMMEFQSTRMSWTPRIWYHRFCFVSIVSRRDHTLHTWWRSVQFVLKVESNLHYLLSCVNSYPPLCLAQRSWKAYISRSSFEAFSLFIYSTVFFDSDRRLSS